MTRRSDAGFTLIETLVALAVLALSSMAFLGAAADHVARIGALEHRTAALLAAQNYLEEVSLGLTPGAEAVVLGIPFAVTAERRPTADPALVRLDIAVREATGSRVHARLTGFVAEAGGDSP